MNDFNNSCDDVVECPLCMEPLEVDDLNFYPCTCGYQICRFCWHRIRTDENELCPACRKEYPENPADFTPLTQEEMIAFKSQKRQRDQQRKQKITENRKHLSNVRVVQKNLVFVVGLPPRLADSDVLKKHEYFGKFGKIHKVVINPSTTYAGVQGPSASAYVTYMQNCDALRAIQSVNNIMIDGRLIKTSLGTTKYCSHFMKNQQCPKSDCMYLHELGDPEASFTKEEMHQGKHQDYEKRLHDALIASVGASTVSGIGVVTTSNGTGENAAITPVVLVSAANTSASTATSQSAATSLSFMSTSSTSSSSSTISIGLIAARSAVSAADRTQKKNAWPSLSMSPVNKNKDIASAVANRYTKNRRGKKHERITRNKNRNKDNSISYCNTTTNKENNQPQLVSIDDKETDTTGNSSENAIAKAVVNIGANEQSSCKAKAEKCKTTPAETDRSYTIQPQANHHEKQQKKLWAIGPDDEEMLIQSAEKVRVNCNTSENICAENAIDSTDNIKISGEQCSLSTVSNNSSPTNTLILTENTNGKTSPNILVHHINRKNATNCTLSSSAVLKIEFGHAHEERTNLSDNNSSVGSTNTRQYNYQQRAISSKPSSAIVIVDSSATPTAVISQKDLSGLNINMTNLQHKLSPVIEHIPSCGTNGNSNILLDTSAALSKLNIFDDNNSFFSSAAAFHSSLIKHRMESDINQIDSATTSHLPDLLNGIDGFKNSTSNKNEWEEAFKNIMIRNSQNEGQLYHSPLQLHQMKYQKEPHRTQKLLTPNKFFNVGLPQVNGPHNDFPNVNQDATDLSGLSQTALVQQQHQIFQQQRVVGNSLFGTNMSKFFDFHKNQQQMHQQLMLNGSNQCEIDGPIGDDLCLASLLENNRISSQYLDKSDTGILSSSQHQDKFQKQHLFGRKINSLQQSQKTHQESRIPNQFSHNFPVDDDLGFDPFIETQKALAELMENEMVQQKNENCNNINIGSTAVATKILQHQQQISQQQPLMDNIQRARMPPPGFNHMNAFGFGMPRAQNSSKILPFIYINSKNSFGSGQDGQPLQAPSSTWNPHMAVAAMEQHTLGTEAQLQINTQQNQNGGNFNKGYSSSNDWTTMDPAILSFRQFSPFSQQLPPMPQHHPSQNLFMQHVKQHHGFDMQSQLHSGINSSNSSSTLSNSQNTATQIPKYLRSSSLI